MGIAQRLKELIDFTGLSVRAFSSKCGISQATLDKQIKGLRGVSIETIMNILQSFPDLSSEWLIRGDGPMFTQKIDNTAEVARINKLIDTISALQEVTDAKSDTITTMAKRITELENQLKNK